MSSYNDVVSKDIELLQLINHKIDQSNWLSDFFAKVVSKNPLKDVVLVLWFFFIFGLFEVGSKHFWVVIMNLIVVVRKFLETFCFYVVDLLLSCSNDDWGEETVRIRYKSKAKDGPELW